MTKNLEKDRIKKTQHNTTSRHQYEGLITLTNSLLPSRNFFERMFRQVFFSLPFWQLTLSLSLYTRLPTYNILDNTISLQVNTSRFWLEYSRRRGTCSVSHRGVTILRPIYISRGFSAHPFNVKKHSVFREA